MPDTNTTSSFVGCQLLIEAVNTINSSEGAPVVSSGAIAVPGGQVTSGGAITSGCAIFAAASPEQLDNDMFISGGSSIIFDTSFPVDLNSSYQDFIAQKTAAMGSGGSCVFAGNLQSFSGGYVDKICTSSVMTINGVSGALEKNPTETTKYLSNITLAPTVGCWVENVPTTNDDTAIMQTVLNTIKPCITCEDYNTLLVMEMMLYHAINNVAWRIMRKRATSYPAGVWQQYQGALARWNVNTYSAQYVYDLSEAEDTFMLKLGWINTTCTSGAAFAAYSDIQITSPSSSPYFQYRILYGGSPNIKQVGYISPSGTPSFTQAVAFIANIETPIAANKGKIYFLTGNQTLMAEVLANFGTVTALSSLCDSNKYTAVDSPQDFNNASNVGVWRVGIICGDMRGDAHGAVGIQLGFAQRVEDDIDTTSASPWIYTVNTYWYVNLGTAPSTPSYSRPNQLVAVNGIVEHEEETT